MNDSLQRQNLDRRSALKLAGAGVLAALLPTTLVRAAALRPETTPAPLVTEFVYEALVTIEPAIEAGRTSKGIRRHIPITGGTFAGPRIEGVILPGGADWQLTRDDSVTEVDALYAMKCADGTVIIVRNSGVIAAGGSYLRTSPRFEAPQGPHDWLNRAVFVGSIAGAPQPGAVIIRVFQVL